MRRQSKLIHKILEYVETEQQGNYSVLPPEFDDYSPVTVHYHIGLCNEAGFIVVDRPGLYDGMRLFPGIQRMTWRGHEELDRLRKEGCGR